MKYSNLAVTNPLTKGLVALCFAVAVFSFSGCNKDTLRMENRSASSLGDLIKLVKEAYVKGDHYTIMTYMNNESLDHDLAQAIAQSLSLGANPSKNVQLLTEVIPWEDFENISGIPGSFKGRELEFVDSPEGVIQIVTVNGKAGSRYTIDLAYFSEDGGYRLCGIDYR